MVILDIDNHEEFLRLVQDTTKKVVVDFYATWCGPCNRIAPFFHELAMTYHDTIHFIRINIDENDNSTQYAGIVSLPTFKAYADGIPFEEVIGFDKVGLLAMVKNLHTHSPSDVDSA